MLGLREILQVELAEIAERDAVRELGARERRGSIGDEDLSAVRSRGDACRAMYIDADVVRAGFGARRIAFAGVHAHAHADRGAVREGRRGKRALRGARRADGLRGDRKDHEQRVTFDAHLEPAVLEGVAQRPCVYHEHVVEAVGAELVQELRRSLDVGEQERDGTRRKRSPLAHRSFIVPHRVCQDRPHALDKHRAISPRRHH